MQQRAAVEAVGECRGHGEPGVLGLHLEGPFIDAPRVGAHDPGAVRTATVAEVGALLARPSPSGDAAGGPASPPRLNGPGAPIVRLVTASPGALARDPADLLLAAGVRLSIGHCDATGDEALEAFNRGFTGVTHLFNAMSALSARDPGVVGAALSRPDVWASVIGDGQHVHPAAMRLATQAKGSRLMLASDAMPAAGAPTLEGRESLPGAGAGGGEDVPAGSTFALGPYRVSCSDGRCVTEDGVLAGSAVGLDAGVRWCVDRCGIAVDEALRMASTYPARYLGVDGELGLVAPGHRADLVILDQGLDVLGVVRRGLLEWYARSGRPPLCDGGGSR